MSYPERGQVWQDASGRRVKVTGFRNSPTHAGMAQAIVENVKTRRTSHVLVVPAPTGTRINGYGRVASCESCTGTAAEPHTPCCSSHGKVLCCICYRRFHFVETGDCGHMAEAASG